MAGEKHYLDNDGLLYYNTLLKSKYLDGASYSDKTLTITKNGSSSVSIKPLLITAQTLTTEEQAQARSNIGAGSSGFSGSFTDLTNVPTTISGYGITDAKIEAGVITLGSNTITPVTDISGKADAATTLAGYGITDASVNTSTGVFTLGSNTYTVKIDNGVITLGSNTITPLTSHQDISGKADKATTLAGYGITDASVNTSTGVFTLGSNTYTVKIDNGVLTVGSNTWSLSNVYRYKGSVATKAALDAMTQSSLTPGDVYNVEADGQNYAYVSWDSTNNKPVWDALGGTFTITSITNAEIDAIVNPTT